ncbi:MAG: pseudouridine synthase, partial [Lachnospiraceae bacterium]|nr:pseudouridine synthase [Lachnospiraceae bacterium]
MRADRLLSDMGCGTRSELRKTIRNGNLSVNGQVVTDPGFNVKASDVLLWRGEPMVYEMYQYFILNKPEGVITTTEQTSAATVMDFCKGEGIRDDLFPVGRLDKDTTGLLLLTNEGALDHMLMSPKTHVQKEYEVTLAKPFDPETVAVFLNGFDVPASEKGNDAFHALPSSLIQGPDPCKVSLVLTEGKYHQVKRMFQVFGNEVTALKRTRIGRVTLPEDLQSGEIRRVDPDLLRPEDSLEDLLKKDALLFDMDGTLIDSMGMWYDIDVEFCKRHKIDMPETLQTEIEGMSFYATAVYVLNRFPEELAGLKPEDLMDEWNEMAYEQY